MRKSLPIALLLTLAFLSRVALGGVTTAPDTIWDLKQQIKDLQTQIQNLEAQVAQLQSENQDLKDKLAKTQAALDAAATQPAKPVAVELNPPDTFKDYPKEKMPAYGDPNNLLRVRALNDYLAKTWNTRLVTITGKFQSTFGAAMGNDRGFTIRIAAPDNTGALHWFIDATLPNSATDDILRLKKDDPITITGAITRITYTPPNAKFSTLTITLKDCSLNK